MSPRLRVTLECKVDAFETKEILNRVIARRRTNKRVKHWIEMRRGSTRQETLLPNQGSSREAFYSTEGGGIVPKRP